MPTAQHTESRLRRSTESRFASIAWRSSRGSMPARDRPAPAPGRSALPTAIPKDANAARSLASSAVRFLNNTSSFQTNSTCSPKRRRGESPRRRERTNRSSAFADRDPANSSVHQSGHAALMARRLIPAPDNALTRDLVSLSSYPSIAPQIFDDNILADRHPRTAFVRRGLRAYLLLGHLLHRQHEYECNDLPIRRLDMVQSEWRTSHLRLRLWGRKDGPNSFHAIALAGLPRSQWGRRLERGIEVL